VFEGLYEFILFLFLQFLWGALMDFLFFMVCFYNMFYEIVILLGVYFLK
jgi:hypothetical protein